MSTKPVRRTQAERSAGTRAALLDAAIRSLHRYGYAATTTLLVAKDAEVSRGAMLHQFATKVDLMMFVVESVYEEELDRYEEKLGGISDPQERVLAMPRVVWEVLSRPSGVAVLEILQGSRSDPALAERLAPLQARIERDALESLSGRLGMPKGATLSLMRLVVWAVRGLSIAQVLAPDPENIPKSVDLLQRLIAAGMREREAAAGERPRAL